MREMRSKDGSEFSLYTQEEIRRAEHFLNEDAPRPRTIALAVGAFVLLVLTKTASASPIPVQPLPMPAAVQAMSRENCSMKLKTIQFAGNFSWKTDSKSKASQPLRFVIGQPENGPKGTAVAQIWSGNQCQASCSSVDFESGELSMPIALDLQCRGEELGALAAHVAVLWNHAEKPSNSTVTLRFGSWVEGYEQAPLNVEVDHFNAVADLERPSLAVPNARVTKLAFRAPGLGTARIEH